MLNYLFKITVLIYLFPPSSNGLGIGSEDHGTFCDIYLYGNSVWSQSLNIVMVLFLEVRFTLFTSPNPGDQCLMLTDLTIEGTRLVLIHIFFKTKNQESSRVGFFWGEKFSVFLEVR